MSHWGSVIGEKLANTVHIVGNNLNVLITYNFGNNKLESLKGALRNLEGYVEAF